LVAKEVGEFDPGEVDSELLRVKLRSIADSIDEIDKRLKLRAFSNSESRKRAEKVKVLAQNLETKFNDRLKALDKRKKSKKSKDQLSILDIAKDLAFEGSSHEPVRFESLADVLRDFEIEIEDRLEIAVNFIDDNFLERDDSEEYHHKLDQLREDLERLA